MIDVKGDSDFSGLASVFRKLGISAVPDHTTTAGLWSVQKSAKTINLQSVNIPLCHATCDWNTSRFVHLDQAQLKYKQSGERGFLQLIPSNFCTSEVFRFILSSTFLY
jgi:hypothetical protein